MARRAVRGVVVSASVMVLVAGCAKEENKNAAGEVDASGFVLESASEIGPNAFTPPVDIPEGSQSASSTAGGSSGGAAPVCDKAAFIKDLKERPDAMREWAAVLQIPESSVPTYVNSLETATLAADLKVTNHGLKDGKAYPRATVMAAGTAVLVDPNKGGTTGPPPSYRPPASTTLPSTTLLTTTTTAGKTTTIVATGYPVTRCKCGNPLLPPPPPGGPQPSNGTFPPGTYNPGTTTRSTAPGTTARPTTTTSRPGGSSSTSSTRPSSSTSSSPSSSVAPSSVTTPSSQPAPPVSR